MVLEGQSEIREIYLLWIEHINSLHPLDQTPSYPPSPSLGSVQGATHKGGSSPG
jgi:hypothetical protein